MADSIVVIAAHPDDEILGAGGTMAKHCDEGDEVSVLIMGQGITSRHDGPNQGEGQSGLKEAAQKANALLGVKTCQVLDFPDNRMDGVALLEVVKPIEEFIARTDPRIIYSHHDNDLNVDHRITAQAVFTAARPLPESGVERILSFEVPSSTEWQFSGPAFRPNWFTDISQQLERKLEALSCYESEMRPWPHARSVKAVEHLARWRGAAMGLEAAEAFSLGRAVEHQKLP